jgi:hypothetical protein
LQEKQIKTRRLEEHPNTRKEEKSRPFNSSFFWVKFQPVNITLAGHPPTSDILDTLHGSFVITGWNFTQKKLLIRSIVKISYRTPQEKQIKTRRLEEHPNTRKEEKVHG